MFLICYWPLRKCLNVFSSILSSSLDFVLAQTTITIKQIYKEKVMPWPYGKWSIEMITADAHAHFELMEWWSVHGKVFWNIVAALSIENAKDASVALSTEPIRLRITPTCAKWVSLGDFMCWWFHVKRKKTVKNNKLN